MIKSPDEALKKFEELVNTNFSNLSETDTRCKLIDPLFKECLNWDETDIKREDDIQNGYIDYLFKKGENILFIVEAKKEGLQFEIPPNFANRRYKINGVIAQCKNLLSAIEQVQRYCIEKGVKIAVISNGYQYVVFEAFKSGSSWRDGTCIIFNGFEDIKTNFNLFFKHFNKNSVSIGSLHSLFTEKDVTLKFYRALDTITNSNASLTRNYLHSYVSPFINFIFRDITESTQLAVLKACYVYDKAYKVTDIGIKQLFFDRVPHYARSDNIKWFEEKEKSAGWFEECVNRIRKSTKKGQLILLLGGIGSGKTTFLHRFYNIILENELKNMWFYVDFKTAPISQDKLDEYIYDKIIENFEEKYLHEVKTELDKFDIILNKNDKLKYIQSLFAILRLMNYSVSVVLDNVDRCDKNLQEKIFLTAQYLVDKLSIITILSLREESYYKFKLTGIFDAYHIQKFHISSPKFEKLILYRIDYLLKLLEQNDEEIGRALDININFDGKKQEVINFFNTLKNSLDSSYDYFMKPITLFITCISEGDMRIALDMFNNFLLSGNTKVEEIMNVIKKGDKYFIAEYQFLKSVILSDSRYYRGDKSYIMNLFDLNNEFTTSHFIHLRILDYAFINRYNESIVGRGFIEINKLIQEAEDLFIPKDVVEDSLKKLLKFNLIKLDNETKDDLKTATYFSLTATGAYYLTQLVKKFIYIDLIHPDTPIADKNLVDFLRRRIDSQLLEEKFDRCYKFLEYLLDMEKEEFQMNPEYQNSNLTKRKFIEHIMADFKNERDKIINKPKNRFMITS